MAEDEKEKKLSLAQMEAELKLLEIQAAKLSLLEKEANLQDIKERLAERQMTRETKFMRAKTNGQTIAAQNQSAKQRQARCNHRKGGSGYDAIMNGQGDDSQYAVYMHMFCNGDIYVRCLRCGKDWRPPVKEWYDTHEMYLDAYNEYQKALNFQTRNSMSTSYVFRFSDNGAYFREVMRHANLR